MHAILHDDAQGAVQVTKRERERKRKREREREREKEREERRKVPGERCQCVHMWLSK